VDWIHDSVLIESNAQKLFCRSACGYVKTKMQWLPNLNALQEQTTVERNQSSPVAITTFFKTRNT
jgi:hypothetical protein